MRSRQGRVWWIGLLAASLAGANGCVPPRAANDSGGPAPGWAMHINPPLTVQPLSTPQQIQTLVDELKRPGLEPGVAYLAPEQIVAMASVEVGQGNPWDAALLLSVATYRYWQQAKLAGSLGELDAQDPRKDPALVYRLRAIEMRALGQRDLMAELAALRAYLRTIPGATAVEPAPSEGAETMPKAERSKLGTADERLAHPQLATAFLDHLQGLPGNQFGIRLLMEVTPLVAFRRAALPRVSEFHPTWFVPDTTTQLAAMRADYLGALRSPLPSVRSAAAFVLGTTEEATSLDALRAALAAEQDPRAALTMKFALSRLGDTTHQAAFVPAMSSAPGDLSTHALSISRALPLQVKASIDSAPITRVLLDRKWSAPARAEAASLLADLAEARPLPDAGVAALLEMCATGKTEVALSACRALGQLKQLDRAKLFELLPRHAGANQGLFWRWSKLSEEADLPALDGYFENARKRSDQAPELVLLAQALGRIPGSAASEMLANWYVRTEDYLTAASIARQWSRPNVDEAARERLLSRVDGPKRLFLRVATGDPKASDEARPFVDQADGRPLHTAAWLAGHPRVPGTANAPLLWQLARFHDPRLYPQEVALRLRAVASLFRIELYKKHPPPGDDEVDLPGVIQR